MPALTLSIDATKMFAAFDKIPLIAARELRMELKEGLRVVQRDAATNHVFKSGSGHSGNLERSIKVAVSGSGLEGSVYLDDNIASYGKYQHEGTRDHVVSPSARKALYWVQGGNKRFSAGHKVRGIKKDQFLYSAFDRQKPFLVARMKAAVKRVFETAGLK
jgi:hypothetical protein